MIKTRIFPEHNYKGIHVNGKTIRIALNPKQPITELLYPEFFDISISNFCKGECPWCYQDSNSSAIHPVNIVEKFRTFFSRFTENQLPFQLAIGGGEATTHPEFIEILRVSKEEFDIVPNYTTNGMWVTSSEKEKILDATAKYCGGVAVSTHRHLEKYWKAATEEYLARNIFTNLHVIISDKKSIDQFMEDYRVYRGRVKYFVLLPLTAQGRAKEATIDWDYLVEQLPDNVTDVAFGANFYPHLVKDNGKKFKVSLYTPEIMSGYLKLEDMKVYKSSFSSEIKQIGNGDRNSHTEKIGKPIESAFEKA